MNGMLGAGATSSSSEDKQMFLELMVAQLSYQDPMNPTDYSAFLAPTAQFNALVRYRSCAEWCATNPDGRIQPEHRGGPGNVRRGTCPSRQQKTSPPCQP